MEPSAFQSAKLALSATLELSKDALHIYVGLAAQIGTSATLRKSLGSMTPWIVVISLACLGEALDMRDDIMRFGHWRFAASLHDFLNTLFWPTVVLLLVRFTRLFRRSE